MVERDASLCGYLYESYEAGHVVMNLITAVDELTLVDIEPEIAERWVTLLLWFTCAPDLRIKNNATRGATSILTNVPSIIPKIVDIFMDVDDDGIREQTLLSSYGAMLLSRKSDRVYETASLLYERFVRSPADFNNAVIRDLMRCICELAVKLSFKSASTITPRRITEYADANSWPLEIPSDEDIDKWAESIHFKPGEFDSDFFSYSMTCLRPWTHAVSQLEMGKWIAQRIARDFGYFESRCEGYDNYMLQKYGGGRAKPVWAERIAKKYAWIALSQLASRLKTNIERRLEIWEGDASENQLILPQARKLDPTLLVPEKGSIQKSISILLGYSKAE